MGIDLTQDQINRLFAETQNLVVKVNDVHHCLNEIKPDLAVVKSQTALLNNAIYNGLAARIRRIEYFIIATFVVLAADKGSSIADQAASLISLLVK